jgi:hypothetical protein
MSNRRQSCRFGFVLGVLLLSVHDSRAQSLFVGATGFDTGPALVSGVQTFIQTGYGADRDGSVNLAGFSWSQAPCPAAVKIKFFRPSSDVPGGELIYLDQRGPFDVTSSQQRVRLDPPVPLRPGDLIAITRLTSCGGPMIATNSFLPGPAIPIPPYLAVAGDVSSNVVLPAGGIPTSGPAVDVFAVDQSLFLLNGRFRITLLATNPRTGAIALGFPMLFVDYQAISTSGYFTLPDFTSNAYIPEVVVKMVDATGTPSLGGDFWIFHAPLTDVQYTMTVTDQTTGAVRTYTNTSSGPGQLCGGVDTSAFPGP